jgi:putative sterol carrier protein
MIACGKDQTATCLAAQAVIQWNHHQGHKEASMGIKFASDEWMVALKDELGKSDGYRDAAKTWEGDFYWIVTGMPGEAAEVYLYVDLWHGDCRAAVRVADAAAKTPEFVIEATYAVWRKVVDKKLDPIQGMVTRQLKLKGNMLKIMKAPKAATELVLCATRVATDWPA